MSELYFTAIVLIGFRLAPLTLVAPIFVFTYLPVLIRVVLTIVVATIIALALDNNKLVLIPHSLTISMIACELFLGLLLAFGFHAASAIVHMMSQLIDTQIGFSAGATFDPVSFQTTSPIGTLLSMVIVLIFFLTDLHYGFFLAFSELFGAAPPGVLYVIDNSYFYVISGVFAAGFVVASPIVICLWLVDVGLSLISRSLPQAQIYFVAMPLKILIGLFILSLMLKDCQQILHAFFEQIFHSWNMINRI